MKKKYYWIVEVFILAFVFTIVYEIISSPCFLAPFGCNSVSKSELTKNEACRELVAVKNCNTSTDSIFLKDFDANKNSIKGDSGDTLFALCQNYFGRYTDSECKIICGCNDENVAKECPICSQPTSWSNCSNNQQIRYNYVCNETTNYTCKSYVEIQICQIPENETALLYSKTCDELFNLSSIEFEKIDFSCINDGDCNKTYVFMCGGCINKNSDVTRYGWIESILNYKGCITNVASCKILASCKCMNNKCESL
jgi:hypothetical protein